MKRRIQLLLLAALIAMTAVLFSSCNPQSEGDYVSTEQREAHIAMLKGTYKELKAEDFDKLKDAESKKVGLDDMSLIMENSKYALYMDMANTAICVFDKTNIQYYHSDPSRVSGISLNENVYGTIASPISIEAYDVSNKRYSFNFINNGLEDQNFQIVQIDKDTIRVIYTVGNDPDKDLRPPVMTPETWEWVVEQLSAQGKEGEYMISDLESAYKYTTPSDPDLIDYIGLYGANFPKIETQDHYILRTQTTTRQKKSITEAMTAAGFTAQMVKDEMEKVDYQGPERAVMYTIPIDLTLDEQGFKVDLDSSLILGPNKQKMYKIFLYRGFGAIRDSSKEKTAYMIVPDGSGALMPVKGNLKTDAFSQRVYGDDESFSKDVLLESKQSVLSGFAVSDRGDFGGMMVMIEDGAAQSYVTVRPINSTNNPVASVNFDFIYSERDYRTYSSGGSTDVYANDTAGSGVILSKEKATANYSVRYMFTEGGLTYADYAKLYRDYLIAAGRMPKDKLKLDSELPFYAELLGTIDATETKLGLPVEVKEVLTTYEDIETITNKLIEAGIPSNVINLKYSFWANEGYFNTANNTVDLIKEAGSEKELKDLLSYLTSKKVGFYPSAEFMYVYRDTLSDGLSLQNDSARRLDMRVARTNFRAIPSGIAYEVTDTYRTILSADIMPSMAASYKTAFEKYINTKSIALDSIGSVVNSNYKNNRIIGRDKAADYMKETIDVFSDYSILFDGGNDYTWAYADHILNLPQGSSEYFSTTGSIPFLQMVLHGYVNYAGEAINRDADYTTALLKCLETGSAVYFRWMGEENRVFDYTDFLEFYSVNYNDSFDQAVALYKEVSKVLNKLTSQAIVNHEACESYLLYHGEEELVPLTEKDKGYIEGKIQYKNDPRIPVGNVFMTEYERGTKIYVNYNSHDIALNDGTVIPAQSYLLD